MTETKQRVEGESEGPAARAAGSTSSAGSARAARLAGGLRNLRAFAAPTAAFAALVALCLGGFLALAALTSLPMAQEDEPAAYPEDRACMLSYVKHESFDQVHTYLVECDEGDDGEAEGTAGSTDSTGSAGSTGSADSHAAEDLSLLLLRANNIEVYANGELYASFGASDYQAVRTVRLSHDFYREGEGTGAGSSTGTAAIGIRASGLFLSYSVYLGPTELIEQTEELYHQLNLASLTVLCVMLVYALSLYACKRNEHYLLVFAVNLITTLVTFFIRMSFQPTGSGASYSTLITFMSCLKYCMVFYTTFLLVSGMKLPSLKTNFAALGAILGISALRSAASALSLSALVSEGTRVALVMSTAVILVWACGRGKDGARILLVGYAPFAACELAKATNMVASCLDFGLWSYTALFDLPFAIACMFFINRRFANSYRVTEELSTTLARMNRTLDLKVEARTQEALEQRARRHNLMLNVFHDLRSPLFVLKGYVGMLKSDAPTPIPREEIVEIMGDRIELAAELTEDLFTLAKLEDGDMVIPMTRVSLSDVLDATVGALTVGALDKGVALTADVREGCVVWGNEERLGQVFQNLVANAIAYTPSGGKVRVELKLELVREPGEEAGGEGVPAGGGGDTGAAVYRVRVSDTGKGIKPEDLEHIFEKYYRVDPKDRLNSSGLGLSIAQSLVERHKGAISVESELGSGSTFVVELPALEG